ncbi:MAG: hypothetical protein JO131_05920, partial [Gammaproteobacteria bacterium]|nr:hypothetical protein [Gammaproteobacteria bacterium]
TNHKSGLLWELTVAKNNNSNGPHDFILKAHHSIFDGTSLGIFMQELVAFYNGEKTFDSPLSFLKPAENLLNQQTNWTRFLLNHFYLQIWEALFSEKIIHRPHACQEKLFSHRKTRMSFYHFDETEMYDLLDACKRSNTTLTALMTAALLQATREVLGELNIETISTPISVRPHFSRQVSDENHIGCYVANTIVKLPITHEMTIWQIAKNYKKALSECMPVIYPAHFDPVKWKLKIMEHEIHDNPTQFSQGVSVSNLGKTHFIANQNSHASLKVQNLYFCASRRAGEKTIQLYAITAAKKLNLCFAHANPLLKMEQAESIREKTILKLKNIIEKDVYERKLSYI